MTVMKVVVIYLRLAYLELVEVQHSGKLKEVEERSLRVKAVSQEISL